MALNKRLIGWVFLALAAPCGHAQSEVYKCPDASGRPTYTNVKRDTVGKNCTLVSKEVSVVPAQVPARALQSSAVSDPASVRNENRRRILESELRNEQQLLSDARQKLVEQEGIRDGDERNYARVLERLKPYQETVSQHTKNIEQLRGELGRLK
ncbi:MAG TPA: DUF4124 domain-containing protein [Burkholderiales bacterium]|nr:DUF4124 domain-containing protein [Burkholderiales bacterium]